MSYRILLVDDDPLLLRAHVRILGGTFELTTAAGPVEAIAALEAASFDGVVCDVVMPGGGGAAVFEAAVRQDPSYADRFWFVTAGTGGDPDLEAATRTGRPVGSKPLTPGTLLGWLCA